MLKPGPRQDRFVTSRDIYESAIPKDHYLVKVEQSVDFTFVNDIVGETYCQDNGRKVTNEPTTMAKALYVQNHYNYADRVMEERANTDLVIKWFLGYNVFEKPFDHTALTRFRDRLGEEGFKEMFFKINKQIQKAGLITPGEDQTIDATDVRSKTAPLSIPQMIHKGITKLLQEIRRISPELEKKIRRESGFEGEIAKEPKEYGLPDAEKQERLTRLVKIANTLIEVIEKYLHVIEDETGRARITSAVELLDRMINERTEEVRSENGEVKRKKKKKKPKDRIASPVDPDARHGHKSSKKPFTGYKVSLTQNKNEIITNVRVDPGNFVDGDAQIPMFDELEERQEKRPKKGIGDKAYGHGKARRDQEKKGTQVVAPLKKPAAKNGQFPNTKFDFDPDTFELTCPNGEKGIMKCHNDKNQSWVFHFPVDACSSCPLRSQCTSAAFRTVSISYYEEEFRKAAEYNGTDDYKADMKRRSGHERKNNELKNQHGMARAKYWGLPKMSIQAYLTSMVVNIKRFVKLKFNPNKTAAGAAA